MNPALPFALAQDEPSIFTLKIGEIGAPPLGTKDPELLVYAEENEFVLVSFDKKSMPQHIAKHRALGRHTCGVVLISSDQASIRSIADDLLFCWVVTEASEWVDRTEYVPLR